MAPRVEIDRTKIEKNTRVISGLFSPSGIDLVGVTKVTCGDPHVARAMLAGGAKLIGDSRLANILRMRSAGVDARFMLLRTPSPAQAPDVVEHSDVTLLTEKATAKALSGAAREAGEEHRVILMVDLGDRREGVMPVELEALARDVVGLDGLVLEGIGTNLACYYGVIPTRRKMEWLLELAGQLARELDIELETLSGGNSANVPLQAAGGHPDGINQVRIGEGIMLGLETVGRTPIPGTHQDAFRVFGELVEARLKPSVPDGEVGQDAFGNKPTFEDRGIIREGLLALGRQDVEPGGLAPDSDTVEVMGGNSDHLILDMTTDERGVGDEVGFVPSYGALLRAMTSPYVVKEYI